MEKRSHHGVGAVVSWSLPYTPALQVRLFLPKDMGNEAPSALWILLPWFSPHRAVTGDVSIYSSSEERH